jgi:hypothetical protein
MSQGLQIAVALAGCFLLGSAAQADTVSKTYVGPNGGTVHYRGDAAPGHYRGAVTVTTPDGDTYRRVTKAHRGPNGTTVSRRWVGPNGAAVTRRTVRY